MHLYLETVSTHDSTIGLLSSLTFRCFTLELPDINNAENISCIPAGHYAFRKHYSPSLGWVIHIRDVPKRTWIYIHAGNFTSEIRGCILVGSGMKDLNNDGIPDVTGSTKTFKKLLASLPDKGTITIRR